MAYCLINSSFAYWYWRLYDGGFNYSLTLLKNTPVFFDKIKESDKKELLKLAQTLQSKEKDYLVYKKNASEIQESVKFPEIYRNEINTLFGNVLEAKTEVLKVVCKLVLVNDLIFLLIKYIVFNKNKISE